MTRRTFVAAGMSTAAAALHLALFQSNPPMPGEDPVIEFFPAWPKEWGARYKLLARGGFLVTASIRNGKVEAVELLSQNAGPCRLRNPFTGELARYTTAKGERITLRKA